MKRWLARFYRWTNNIVGQGANKRQLGERRRRLSFDTLESRHMLTGGAATFLPVTNVDFAAIKAGTPLNSSQQLYDVVREFAAYQAGGSTGQFTSRWSEAFAIDGTQISTYAHATGSATELRDQLTTLGVDVRSVDETRGVVSIQTPISRLSEVAGLSGLKMLTPVDRPYSRVQGSVANQADQTMLADTYRQATGLTGAGQVVGVLSDSVSQVGGGLAASQATGDLPANVLVIEDGLPGDADEGRAMLELIHDVAPGAALAYATATNGGQLEFAQNIDRLRAAGATILVDDIGYGLEPQFQPGVIDLAIKRAVNANIPYFSAIGNIAFDGYEAPLRLVNTGSLIEQDWDPSANVDTRLSVTVASGNFVLVQWDNPYDGVTGRATADIDFFIYDTGGALVDSGVSNNLSTGLPYEILQFPSAGTYTIGATYFAGSAHPTRIKFYAPGSGFDLTAVEYVNVEQFPVAGLDHGAGPYTISVGAVPFFNAPPFSSTTPIRSEPFSSAGPHTMLFDDAGNRLVQPQVLQKPDISAIDGVNTTFFGSDTIRDPDTFPNFFGTSAAAPNAAAATALLRQAYPTATVEQIRTALMSSARPLNGAIAGEWNVVGGYGLIDVPAAAARLASNFTPEIDVSIDSRSIRDGDTTPSSTDGTDFGTVRQFTGQVSRTFTINNVGSAPLQLTGNPLVQITGAASSEFAVVLPPTGSTVPVGGSLTFTVAFTPVLVGNRVATVVIANNDSSEGGYSFSISGTGSATLTVPEIQVRGNGQDIYDGSRIASAANGTDFGTVGSGVTVTRDFTINNVGNAALLLTAQARVVLSGPFASLFSVVQTPVASSIAAAGSATFRISFTPPSLGVFSALVHVFNNDSDEYSFDFTIQGGAAAPGIYGGIWYDLNADGVYTGNEPFASGQPIFLDGNNNLIHDPDEPLTAALSTGGFQFLNVPTGQYNVVYLASSPYYVTTANRSIPITYTGGSVVVGSFGIRVNTAPVLDNSGNPLLFANEDVPNPPGTSIVNLLLTGAGGNPISDVDTLNPQGIAVIAADTNHGAWQYSIDGGANWLGLGAVSAAQARLLSADVNTRVRFIPRKDFSADIPTALTFRAWDGVEGRNGDLFTITATGETSSFSTAIETTTVVLSPSNDAPLIVAPGRQGARPDSTLTFSAANFNRISVQDVDHASLRVTLLANRGSVTLGSVENLTSVAGNGTANVVLNGTLASLNNALAGLQFVPNSGVVGDASLSIIATDSGIGGSTPLSTGVTIPISFRQAFSLEGNTLYVTGTSATELATVQYFSGSQVYVTLDSLVQLHPTSLVTRVVMSLGGGNDAAIVAGDNATESAALAPQSFTLTATGRQLDIGGATQYYVFGSAADSAVFYDTLGDDVFFGLPSTSALQTVNLFNQVIGYGTTVGIASRGRDKTVMFDSPDVDNYYAFEGLAAMQGPGYSTQAFGFSEQWGISNSLGDYAEMRDSLLDDVFHFTSTQATLTTGTQRLAVAYGFERISTVAADGFDQALLFDGFGNEQFVANGPQATWQVDQSTASVFSFDQVDVFSIFGGIDTAQLYDADTVSRLRSSQFNVAHSGNGFNNLLHNFESVYVNVFGDNDYADLFDSAGNEQLRVDGQSVILTYGAPFVAITGFNYVNALSSAGEDLLFIRSAKFKFNYAGSWLLRGL